MTQRFIPLLCVLTLALAPACKKKDEDSTNPDDVTATTGGDDTTEGGEGEGGEEVPDEPALPEQDADPAELADLHKRLLAGDYQAVAADAAELRATLSADTQIRANALAASIQALAAAEIVPENGRDPAEEAIAAGERLGDPEVLQIAHAAHAAYLIGILDSAAAQAEVEAVVDNEGAYAGLARLVLADADLNQAFGSGEEDDKVVNPGKLDDAIAQFEAVAESGDDLLAGHAHEGLAAVYNYKRDKAKTCEHSAKAKQLYSTVGAAQDLIDGIDHLAGKAKCKK